MFAPATLGSSNANYDGARYWQPTGQRAAIRSGQYLNSADCSLATLHLESPPSYVDAVYGFRGVC